MLQQERPAAAGLYSLLQGKSLRVMGMFLPVRQERSSQGVSPAHELSFLWVRDWQSSRRISSRFK
jgi:hypothetical protein